MTTPIILSDHGDIMFFESQNDLLSYIESPDIGRFRVFDSKGLCLKLRTADNHHNAIGWVSLTTLTLEETCESDQEALRNLLVSFLGQLGLLTASLNHVSLEELVNATLKRIGYTK